MYLVGFSSKEFVVPLASAYAKRSRLARGLHGADDAHLDLRSGWTWRDETSDRRKDGAKSECGDVIERAWRYKGELAGWKQIQYKSAS